MSFEHPLALLLLAVPAILLWLRTRAARPRAAEASSLLVWQKVSPSDTVPEKPRPPLAAWIEAAGAVLLVFGMTGPMGQAGAVTGAVKVLIDVSASMEDERAVGKTPKERALAMVGEFAAGVQVQESSNPDADLPPLLESGVPVILVSDHRYPGLPMDMQRFRVVGLGTSGFNAGITGASGALMPNGTWRILLSIEAFGAKGPVEGKLKCEGGDETTVTSAPGTAKVLELDVRSLPGIVDLSFEGDSCPGDNVVNLHKIGGAFVRLRNCPADSESPKGRLGRALVAAGASPEGPAGSDVPGNGPLTLTADLPAEMLDVLPPSNLVLQILLPSEIEGEETRGDGVVATGNSLASGVQVDPSVTLGRRGKIADAGEPVLVDRTGNLVTTWKEEDITTVCFRFLPGGTWVERDPSFVVLAKNLVDCAAGGPARIEATGVLSAKETREAAEGETFGDLRAAIEEARRPDPASRASYAFVLLMLGGGGLAAAWLAMR